MEIKLTCCHDPQCRVQETCWRWVHREDPGIHRHAMVFRHYEDPDGPCHHHLPLEEQLACLTP